MTLINYNLHSFSANEIKQYGSSLIGDGEKEAQYILSLAQQWLSGQLYFVFQTSGSTGNPKQINLHRSQLEASANATIKALHFTANDHILLCINTQFIGGAMMLIRGLMLEATITIQQPTGNPLQTLAENHPFTVASFAPLQLHPLLKNENNELAKLNKFDTILVGGAPINAELEEAIKQTTTKAFHTYGMTETASHIALRKIGNTDFFTALDGIDLKLDDRSCLAITGAVTMHQWIQTNDAVELINANEFKVLGRADDMINSGGVKIWPAKVENEIRQAAGAKCNNVFVVGLAESKLGQQLIAIIEAENWTSADTDLIKRKMEQSLNKYEIPKQYYIITSFSYTKTGKIDKHETLKMMQLE